MVLEPGKALELDVILDNRESAVPARLVLQRFFPVLPSAQVYVDGKPRPLPEALTGRVYLQGQIADDAASRATIIIGREGTTRGLLESDGRFLSLLDDGSGSLAFSPMEEETQPRSFSCSNSQLPARVDAGHHPVVEQPRGEPNDSSNYLAKVALETDYEYYQVFGNTEDAAVYAADLVAFSSTVYSHEVRTALTIEHLSLWTEPEDPWEQQSVSCRLYEFGQYWNNENAHVDRTIAHFLSGKPGGGMAWQGVLCGDEFTVGDAQCPDLPATGNYGGAYGLSSGMQGDFDLASPASVWDIVVVAHEVGHNFGSPHTHCYAGLGGNAEPVDQCYNGEATCYAGSTELPGPSGQGSGTLMSYCHLQSPGIANISLTFGTEHPWGIEPERVPQRMYNHVVAATENYPGCIALPADSIFGDGFEFDQP